MQPESRKIGEKDSAGVCVGDLDAGTWRSSSWRMEVPLEEVDISCGFPLSRRHRLRRSSGLYGCSSWKRKDELWVVLGGIVDTRVGL